MSTFTQLVPLLDQCETLVLIISKKGELITVVTQPKALASSPSGLSNQISLTGTAQELDDGFEQAILGHALQVKSIADQIAESKSQMLFEKQRLNQEPSKPKKVPGKDLSQDTDSPSSDPISSNPSASSSSNAKAGEIELF